jgi:hypothetical protein
MILRVLFDQNKKKPWKRWLLRQAWPRLAKYNSKGASYVDVAERIGLKPDQGRPRSIGYVYSRTTAIRLS